MRIGLIGGSARPAGSTQTFLRKLETLWTAVALLTRSSGFANTELTFTDGPDLDQLPLFSPERLAAGVPPVIIAWATFVKTADLLVVATPEYAHGIPASLKSALEWLVASGEFSRKRCLAVTVTPHAPRGEHCMQALVWVLQALDAQVLAEVPIHATREQLETPGGDAESEWVDLVMGAWEVVTGETNA